MIESGNGRFEPSRSRLVKKVSMLIMIGAAFCAQASLAQFNLAGSWAQRQHEDRGERGGGPQIGD